MGQFSWITQDTNRSISNLTGHTFKVIMCDNKGNQWIEEDYEGYGEFGGKDFHELTAEMNGMTKGDLQDKRAYGIDLECKRPQGHIFPSLSECGAWFHGKKPKSCPSQGWVENP